MESTSYKKNYAEAITMDRSFAKNFIIQLFQLAGITVNGPNPWDIHVHNEAFYPRLLSSPEINLGDSYVEGWWDCVALDEFFDRVLRAHLDVKIQQNSRLTLNLLFAKFINFQTKQRAKQVGKIHYDLALPLFQAMLDSRMNYTCGYWKNADTLDQAQVAKLDLVCKKLYLKPGMRLLDIGCGWGGLAKYAAENYGATVVGITISQQQYEYAKEDCAGLPIEIRLQDYRDVNESFDRIASIGMFEHVGHLNYRTYMQMANRCLTDDGIFLLHTIGTGITTVKTNAWIARHIFPNGMLPSIKQIGKAIEGLFCMEDWHNFGPDYDKTLMAWHHNFETHWEELRSHFDNRFYRLWRYYLLSCAGSFRARDIQLWQIVLSKNGLPGGYLAPR